MMCRLGKPSVVVRDRKCESRHMAKVGSLSGLLGSITTTMSVKDLWIIRGKCKRQTARKSVNGNKERKVRSGL